MVGVPEGFVLNVYKEVSWTSHDAVQRVRRILGIRRVGHAGALDPLANGTLLVAVGRGTKLVPYLMELPKRYRGTLLLGRRTSTGDLGGKVVAEAPVPALSRDQLERAAGGFQGTYLQIPPMVSAVKHEGRRLYELARQGLEVEREARPVEIRRFQILELELPRVDFEVECGRGTYVRTLVEDFAAKLSTVATVEALTRSAVGSFEVADSLRLISSPGNTREGLVAGAIPLNAALDHLPAVRVERRWIHRLRQGGLPPRTGYVFEQSPRFDSAVRMVGPDDELIALARCELLPGPADRAVEGACTLRLERVL